MNTGLIFLASIVSAIGITIFAWKQLRDENRRENFDKAEKFLTRNLRCPACGHNRIGSFCARCGEALNPPQPEVSKKIRQMELADRAARLGYVIVDDDLRGVTISDAPLPGIFKPVGTPAPPPSKYHFFNADKIR